MNLRKTIFLFSLLAALVSCGNGKGKVTKTNFIFSSAIANIGGQTGGIMVFGENRETGQKIRFVLSNEPVELANGVWDFLYSSWDGLHSVLGTSSHQLEGALRCGQSIGVNLDGADTPVSMILSSAGCASPYFGSATTKDGGGLPKLLEIHGCSNGGVFKDGGDTNPSNCKFSPGQSFQVFLPELLPNGSVRAGLESRCITNNNVFPTAVMNSSTAHEIRVPMYLPAIGGPIVGVRIFEGLACETLISETRISHLYAGKYQGHPSTLYDNLGATGNDLMVKVNVCDTVQGSQTTPFEYESARYAVCTKDQFAYINSNSTFQYYIDQDIDFEDEVFTGHVVDILGPGGVIDGQGNTLSNITINSSATATGFISASEGAVRNLKMSNISINCSTQLNGTGALIGNISNGGEVSNIELSNATIDAAGCDYVGGMFGKAIPSVFDFRVDNLKVQNIAITFDENSEFIGGLVGSASKSGSANNHFANIFANNIRIDNVGSQTTNKENIGGLFGALRESQTTVHNVLATNIAIGAVQALEYKKNVGLFAGLLGFAAIDGPSISSVKVHGSIHATSNTEDFGGIAGRVFSSQIRNIVSELELNAPSTVNAGGAFGSVEGESLITDINQVRTFGTMDCSNNCGGIIGFARTSSNNTTITEGFSNMAITSSGSSAVGGIIGRSEKGIFNRLQFEGSIVGNANGVGGIAGIVPAVAYSSFSDIVAYGSIGGGDEVGGIVGEFDANATSSDLAFVISNVDITTSGTNTDYAIGLVGLAPSITNCFAVDRDGGAGGLPLVNCTAATSGELQSLVDLDEFGLGGNDSFFSGGGSQDSQLQFVHELGSINGLSRLGSFDEPFSIVNRVGWNSISDSSFFMDKSFRLDSDIDFNSTNGDFNPIGSIANPFKGHFFGNNHALKNIVHIESVSSEPIGIFRVIEADISKTPTIMDIEENDSEYARLYIENTHFEYDGAGTNEAIGTLAGIVRDYNDNTESRSVRIGGITVNGANVITNSTDTGDTSAAGGLIGTFVIDSPETEFEQVTLNNVLVDTTGTSSVTGTGGMIGRINIGLYLGGSLVKMEGHQINSVTVDGGSSSSDAGGFIGRSENANMQFENIILSNSSINGKNSVGGFLGSGSFDLIRGTAISDLSINASGYEVGGFIGLRSGGVSKIDGSYIVADSIIGSDEVGCLAGDATGMTVDNSYFICHALSGTTTSYFSFSSVTLLTSDSVFYVAPSSEAVTGAVYLADDSVLRSPAALISGYPNFLSIDPWVFKDGDLPITVAEEFPEFFFY